jgi:hypothetical protein
VNRPPGAHVSLVTDLARQRVGAIAALFFYHSVELR